ncbi:hypothetical protein HOY80DRAFT_515480 [Tuber brumale]|nr:hypothetical protein HOY80DRAFT_515480 [Tuber brumale]
MGIGVEGGCWVGRVVYGDGGVYDGIKFYTIPNYPLYLCTGIVTPTHTSVLSLPSIYFPPPQTLATLPSVMQYHTRIVPYSTIPRVYTLPTSIRTILPFCCPLGNRIKSYHRNSCRLRLSQSVSQVQCVMCSCRLLCRSEVCMRLGLRSVSPRLSLMGPLALPFLLCTTPSHHFPRGSQPLTILYPILPYHHTYPYPTIFFYRHRELRRKNNENRRQCHDEIR